MLKEGISVQNYRIMGMKARWKKLIIAEIKVIFSFNSTMNKTSRKFNRRFELEICLQVRVMLLEII